MESFEQLVGLEANLLVSEIVGQGDVVKSHPDVQAALARRGYDRLDFVDCSGPPAGYYATPEQ